MLILGIDTSGKNGSIALVRFGRGEAQTLDLVPLEGGTFSAQLVLQISVLLKSHGFKKEDIEGFSVASGPGSFTGLRVGLAAIKALAEVLHKPIAAVSRLEVVARSAEASAEVLAALDAGRNEVYSGFYRLEKGSCRLVSEDLLSVPEFLARGGGHTVITPDRKLAESARSAQLHTIVVPLPQADAIARLGYEKIQAGQTISPEALDATYIRRSDAEIANPSSWRP
jgi:tRNA threonylcarbamoyladenosine biosynthesis protein TsaB